MAFALSPSTWEAEEEGQDFEVSLGCIADPVQEKKSGGVGAGMMSEADFKQTES